MKLSHARLCMNMQCNEVHEGKTCPACGGEVNYFIQHWIDREEGEMDCPKRINKLCKDERFFNQDCRAIRLLICPRKREIEVQRKRDVKRVEDQTLGIGA